MPNSALFAPWRMDYIRSLENPEEGKCFLCLAAEKDARLERLVLWQTKLTVVLMNRYPYTSGHLLVAPLAHKAELCDLTHEELCDLNVQTTRSVELLKRAMSPHGFNIGINIGRAAGAGVPGHLHQHVVPRWAGDSNFMNVVGEIRVIPEATEKVHAELMKIIQSGVLGSFAL